MSVQAKIIDGYKNAKRLLKASGIVFSENTVKPHYFSRANYSVEFIEASQEKDYGRIYLAARKNFDYDILLDDQSIFQFTFETNKKNEVIQIRYAYFEPHIKIIPYKEFLYELGFSYDDVGDGLFEEYEQLKSEADNKKYVTPIRYDYDYNLYHKIKHPISHLHIGFNNEIRIPISSIISPNAFVGFIIRHIYYKKWKMRADDMEYYNYYIKLRTYCEELDNNRFAVNEKYDFHMK